jgi:transcriptional regulator with XRE-family HTH domain
MSKQAKPALRRASPPGAPRQTDATDKPARPLRTSLIQRQITRPVRTAVNLGPKLRSERTARGLSIQQVADAAGVTKSFLSKLETDRVSGSVATMLRICDAMGVRPGTLFDPPSTNLVRDGEARPISLGGEGMVEYLISGDSNEHLMALMSVIQPGGGSGKEPYALTSVVDIVHVKQGRLDVTIEGETFEMRAGDTLTFQPSKPHAWRNPSASDVTVAVWVIVPPP